MNAERWLSLPRPKALYPKTAALAAMKVQITARLARTWFVYQFGDWWREANDLLAPLPVLWRAWEKRKESGEKGRAVLSPQWERTEDEVNMSHALEKVAAEVGAKSITAGVFYSLPFFRSIGD